MMKKILATMVMVMSLFIGSNILVSGSAEAADVWVCTDRGRNVYVTYESVVYGVKTSFYAKARVKTVSQSGELISNNMLEFNQDEGDWWYGVVGSRDSKRVYDYASATEVLRWLQAHRSEAHKTSRPTEMVLR